VAGWNFTPLGAMTRDLVPWDETLVVRNAERVYWMMTMMVPMRSAPTRAPTTWRPRRCR
jgi:hypothetical protein